MKNSRGTYGSVDVTAYSFDIETLVFEVLFREKEDETILPNVEKWLLSGTAQYRTEHENLATAR
jgi:hypothetical protein